MDTLATDDLEEAAKQVKLPQIKRVILPQAAYPLLGPCHDVEDVVCVVSCGDFLFQKFCQSLASNRRSKVKRLAIPLILPGSPSSKWSSTPKNHGARMVTDCHQPQNTSPRSQSSLNLSSSTPTHMTN